MAETPHGLELLFPSTVQRVEAEREFLNALLEGGVKGRKSQHFISNHSLSLSKHPSLAGHSFQYLAQNIPHPRWRESAEDFRETPVTKRESSK